MLIFDTCLTTGDIVDIWCSIVGVVFGNFARRQNQTSVMSLSIAKSDNSLVVEKVGQSGC